MKFAAFVLMCVFGLSLVPYAQAQQPQRSSPWWVTGELGAGQIKLSSDRQQGNRVTTFAMGFAGGYQPTDRLRLGLHLNGWLLQASDYYNPFVGENVSNVGGVVDLFPLGKNKLFARGGYGLSMYSIQRPAGTNGNGTGWEAGGGYEVPIRGRIRLVPMVEYAAGTLGRGSSDTYPIQTGLRYSVLEFKLTVVGSFGHRRR
jgi:hypothetical protein